MTTASEASTVAEAFRRTVAATPDRVAVRTLDDAVSLTWAALAQRVDAVAGGLAKLGVRRGDTVALLIGNRPEFHLVDLAVTTIGATPFSIYQTLPPEQIAYVVGDAGARLAIAETALLPNLLAARRELPGLERVVVIGAGEAGTIPLGEVEGSNPGFDVEAAWRAVTPEDVLTLIYTSGTTGPPKGVQLVHRNIMATARVLRQVIPVPEGGRVISWLPSAHIAERAAHHYLPLIFGLTITTCPNPKELLTYLSAVRPHWFFAVPRIWEKMKAGLEARLAGLPDEQRGRVEAAFAASLEKVRLEQAGSPVPAVLADQVAQADASIFAMLRSMLGLDEAVSVNVGAAPTPREVLEFFHALGIRVGELWGMSETTGTGTVNPPERMKLGTVGKPVPGVEIRLAADGEVLVRGDVVMIGYRNMPEKTAEVLDADGWLATGDVGEIDADGYLRIIDRKKELIINSAGKNMSPANIESALKGASPLIGQVCVIGDARPYNTALVVLEPEYAATWAAQRGIADTPLADLTRDARVRAAVQEAVNRANARLSRVEQIKQFHLVPGDWMPGGDELTPTMKLKRKPISEKYAREIEAMYAGPAEG
ncbi:MAG TPA: long-chain fatty acid--CoA ligase [Candidatus Binatia bacterium]|nr:long-chain fatty acid--CoA ligase [Candidatus Binatia bacterium]